MEEEKLYTLAEARLELKLQECRRLGHDLTNITSQRLAESDLTLHGFRHCLRCKTDFKLVPSDRCEISDAVSEILESML